MTQPTRPVIQSRNTTYEYSLVAVKELIAQALNVDPRRLTLRFKEQSVGDDRLGPTSSEVCGVLVTVDDTVSDPYPRGDKVGL